MTLEEFGREFSVISEGVEKLYTHLHDKGVSLETIEGVINLAVRMGKDKALSLIELREICDKHLSKKE